MHALDGGIFLNKVLNQATWEESWQLFKELYPE